MHSPQDIFSLQYNVDLDRPQLVNVLSSVAAECNLRQRDVTVEHFNGFDIDDLGEAVIEIWPEDQRAGFDKANNYGLTQEKLKTLKQRSEWERYSYVDVEGVTCVVAEVSPRNDRCFLGADIWLQQVIPLLGAFIFINLGSKQGPMLSRVLRSKLGVPLYSE